MVDQQLMRKVNLKKLLDKVSTERDQIVASLDNFFEKQYNVVGSGAQKLSPEQQMQAQQVLEQFAGDSVTVVDKVRQTSKDIVDLNQLLRRQVNQFQSNAIDDISSDIGLQMQWDSFKLQHSDLEKDIYRYIMMSDGLQLLRDYGKEYNSLGIVYQTGDIFDKMNKVLNTNQELQQNIISRYDKRKQMQAENYDEYNDLSDPAVNLNYGQMEKEILQQSSFIADSFTQQVKDIYKALNQDSQIPLAFNQSLSKSIDYIDNIAASILQSDQNIDSNQIFDYVAGDQNEQQVVSKTLEDVQQDNLEDQYIDDFKQPEFDIPANTNEQEYMQLGDTLQKFDDNMIEQQLGAYENRGSSSTINGMDQAYFLDMLSRLMPDDPYQKPSNQQIRQQNILDASPIGQLIQQNVLRNLSDLQSKIQDMQSQPIGIVAEQQHDNKQILKSLKNYVNHKYNMEPFYGKALEIINERYSEFGFNSPEEMFNRTRGMMGTAFIGNIIAQAFENGNAIANSTIQQNDKLGKTVNSILRSAFNSDRAVDQEQPNTLQKMYRIKKISNLQQQEDILKNRDADILRFAGEIGFYESLQSIFNFSLQMNQKIGKQDITGNIVNVNNYIQRQIQDSRNAVQTYSLAKSNKQIQNIVDVDMFEAVPLDTREKLLKNASNAATGTFAQVDETFLPAGAIKILKESGFIKKNKDALGKWLLITDDASKQPISFMPTSVYDSKVRKTIGNIFEQFRQLDNVPEQVRNYAALLNDTLFPSDSSSPLGTLKTIMERPQFYKQLFTRETDLLNLNKIFTADTQEIKNKIMSGLQQQKEIRQSLMQVQNTDDAKPPPTMAQLQIRQAFREGQKQAQEFRDQFRANTINVGIQRTNIDRILRENTQKSVILENDQQQQMDDIEVVDPFRLDKTMEKIVWNNNYYQQEVKNSQLEEEKIQQVFGDVNVSSNQNNRQIQHARLIGKKRQRIDQPTQLDRAAYAEINEKRDEYIQQQQQLTDQLEQANKQIKQLEKKLNTSKKSKSMFDTVQEATIANRLDRAKVQANRFINQLIQLEKNNITQIVPQRAIGDEQYQSVKSDLNSLEALRDSINQDFKNDKIDRKLASLLNDQIKMISIAQKDLTLYNYQLVDKQSELQNINTILRQHEEKISQIQKAETQQVAPQQNSDDQPMKNVSDKNVRAEALKLQIISLLKEKATIEDTIKNESKKILALFETGSIAQLMLMKDQVQDKELRDAIEVIGTISKNVSAEVIQQLQSSGNKYLQDDVAIQQFKELSTQRMRELIQSHDKLQQRVTQLKQQEENYKSKIESYESRKKQLKRERENLLQETNRQQLELKAQKLEAGIKIKEILQSDIKSLTQAQVNTLAVDSVQQQELQQLIQQRDDIQRRLTQQQPPDKNFYKQQSRQLSQQISELKKEVDVIEKQQKKVQDNQIELKEVELKLDAEKNFLAQIEKSRDEVRDGVVRMQQSIQNIPQFDRTVIENLSNQSPLVNYADNVRVIKETAQRVGWQLPIIASQENTITEGELKKYLTTTGFLTQYQFPIQAFTDMFKSNKERMDNQLTDYAQQLAVVQSIRGIAEIYNQTESTLKQDGKERFKQFMQSDDIQTKLKKAFRRIGNFQNYVANLDTQILPKIEEANSRYIELYSVFGEDLPTVQEFQSAANQVVNAVNTFYTNASDSESFASNVDSHTTKITNIQTALDNMHSKLSSEKFEKINNGVVTQYAKTFSKMVKDIQNLRDVSKQGLETKQMQERVTNDILKDMANAQRNIMRQMTEKLIVLARDGKIEPFINEAFDSGNLVKAIASLDNITGNQSQNLLNDVVNNAVKNMKDEQVQNAMQIISHQMQQNIQKAVDSVNAGTIKQIVQDPKVFGKNFFERAFSLKDEEIRLFNTAEFLQEPFSKVLDSSSKLRQNIISTLDKIGANAANDQQRNQLKEEFKKQTVDEAAKKQQTAVREIRDKKFDGISNSTFLDKMIGGRTQQQRQSRFMLYDMQNSSAAIFQKRVQQLDQKKVQEMQKSIREERKQLEELKNERYGDYFELEDNKDVYEYVAAQSIIGLKQKFPNAIMPQLYLPDIKQQHTLVDFIKTVIPKIEHNIDQNDFFTELINQGLGDTMGKMQSMVEYFIEEQLPVPQSTLRRLMQNLNTVNELKTLLGSSNSLRTVVPSIRERTAEVIIQQQRPKLDVLGQSFNTLMNNSNQYNEEIVQYNLEQLEQAEDILNNRGRYAEQERKINDYVDKQKDKIYDGVDAMMKKLMLKSSDLNMAGDDAAGRREVRQAINGMVPRAYTQIPARAGVQQQQLRFAHQGSPFEQKLQMFNRQQIQKRGGNQLPAGEEEITEDSLFNASRLAPIQQIAKIDKNAVEFLSRIKTDPQSGAPLMDGQRPLTKEERVKLARLVVAIVIALYSAVFAGQSEVVKIKQKQKQMVEDAQDDEQLPQFVDVIEDLLKEYLKKRNVKTRT